MSEKIISLPDLWSDYRFTPNPKQEAAIRHTTGPLFLTAGPGSGKTRVLLWRTLNLLVYHDVKPEEIFLSTFTEKAAHQLKDGLRTLLGVYTNKTGRPFDLAKMSLGTVHSICQQILADRRFSPDGQRRRTPVLMDALKQYFTIYNRRFWQELIAAGGFTDEEEAQRSINLFIANRKSASRHEAVQNSIAFFNRLSEEKLDPETCETADTDLQAMLDMYAHYLRVMRAQGIAGAVDFSLLQQAAYELLDAFDESGRVFKHVIVDEYQDTNTIQEKLFFKLADYHKNICVVGDDDQALYRFRGATVENLVEFEQRCEHYLGVRPQRIDLDINYRSRKQIVQLYTHFIQQEDWRKNDPAKGHYRIHDKIIQSHSNDSEPSVVATNRAKPEEVYAEIARFVKKLKQTGKIEDYNQCAFLFPAMRGISKVSGLRDALQAEGIPVYAPRAGRFLEVEESLAVWGVLARIFGRPYYRDEAMGGQRDFSFWLRNCTVAADAIIAADPSLKQYVEDRKQEIKDAVSDWTLLYEVAAKLKLQAKDPFLRKYKSEFTGKAELSGKAKANLGNAYFDRILESREREGQPFSVDYIINRSTSIDWSVLDLFYQICGFAHFRSWFDLAEDGTDEGPVCNLALISQYLARFTEEYGPVISAAFLAEERFINTFFGSYTYALFRLGESEYEDADDPFPKGRVPFLTIHQSKGLEFPVVVLGSVFKQEKEPSKVEKVARELTRYEGEPLDRMSRFDMARMFYVGLSRAKNLLILPRYTGAASAAQLFKDLFEHYPLPQLSELDLTTLPDAKLETEDLGKTYSYTADYLNYQKCPRQYMAFRKYGFVPSRAQSMFFGSLVHQTIEDLHHLLINERKKGNL